MFRRSDSSPPSESRQFETEVLAQLGSLMRVAVRLTHQHAEAEDLVQDTVVKALRARGQYEPGTNLKAWLLKILRNTFINRYRRGGLERAVLEGPAAEPMSDAWIGAATLQAVRDPESQALRPVLEQEISRAIDQLPDDFRLAVLMADVEELSYREIAEAMNCPVGTVMSRIHRGRRLLKEQLVKQAEALGILKEEPAETPALQAPVSLTGYRARKRAQ